MSDELTRQEIVDRCIERLLDGESLDDVLASYAGRGAELLPLLKAAGALVAAPSPQPSPAARSLAMSRMLAQVATEARQPKPEGVFAWLGTMRARPLAFQAVAVAGAVVLFAGLGIGASAATGTTPAPVRTLFRLPDDSPRSVRLNGAVLSASDTTLVIDTPDGERTIALSSSTSLLRGSLPIAWSDLDSGDVVNVTGTDRDGHIVAKLVSVPAVPTATPTTGLPTLGATPRPDDGDRTETPRGDCTPEDGGGADNHTPEQPEASSTAGHADENHSATPEATKSPEVEGSRTPEPTKSPEQEHDGTPGPTQTPSSDSGGGDH